LQALAALGFVALGALSSPSGWAGLAALAVSWLGLLASAVQSSRARAVLRAALDAELGAGPADPSPLAQRLLGEPPRAGLVLPFRFSHPAVERIDDIAYATAAGARNRLDVYRPRGAREPAAPVVLQIHGGGWMVGHKRQQAMPLLYQLAASGLVCVSANYRLSPRATFPEHLIDVKRALIWIRRHIAEHGGNPECVVVTGGSAGGHLAALLALTPNLPEYQPGDEEVDTRVQGCVPMYGVYDLAGLGTGRPRPHLIALWERQILKRKLADAPEAFAAASPITHVRADAPPFFVVQGGHDTVVSPEDARGFAQALRGVSRAPVVYAELPLAQHAFDIFHSIRTRHALAAIQRFLAFAIGGCGDREA
jgi:acetyl esterase/lipase